MLLCLPPFKGESKGVPTVKPDDDESQHDEEAGYVKRIIRPAFESDEIEILVFESVHDCAR